MRKRTSYDTTIKHLYREGLEEMIPLSVRKKIPRSTIHRWQNEMDFVKQGKMKEARLDRCNHNKCNSCHDYLRCYFVVPI